VSPRLNGQADLAVQRVAQRVRQGGHAVPEEDVRRRFSRGWDHFETLYKPLVDRWRCMTMQAMRLS
jgi:predicted ABC-type ATPase